MRLESTLNNCSGVQEFASAAANWIGQTAYAVGSAIAQGAQKVAEFVRPYFESLKSFVQENKQDIFIFTIGAMIGAFALHVINSVFCRGTHQHHDTTATTATTTAATTTGTI